MGEDLGDHRRIVDGDDKCQRVPMGLVGPPRISEAIEAIIRELDAEAYGVQS